MLDRETRMDELLCRLRNADDRMMLFGKTLGFHVESITSGEAVVVMGCESHLHNIFGYVHGGAIFTLADTAIGLAHLAALESDQTATTVESKINFIRPAMEGTLRAKARYVKQGRILSIFECDVTDDQERLIARTSATMMTLDDDRSKGRNQLHGTAELFAEAL